MIEEATLFSDADRFFLTREQIDPVTQPDDTYDDQTYEDYFAIYAGITHKYQPKAIFEIGVRYGCTAICMLLGLPEKARADVIYRSVDDESQWFGSCARANRNFAEHAPWVDAHCYRWNAFDGPPPQIAGLAFDLIHIDGLHAYNATSNELSWCWPLVAPGGIILLDDADTPGVAQAIDEFLALRQQDPDVLVRHQFLSTLRNHYLLQRARKRGRPRKTAE